MKILLRMLTAWGVLVVCAVAVLPASAQQESAEQAVDRYIGALLAKMDEIRPLYESDREHYFREIENAVSTFVDFREVARGVMAKYGQGPQGATPEQLERFSQVFRSSLVEFYGSALANYGGVKYEFLDNPQAERDTDRSTNVRMSVFSDDGSMIEIQYTMFVNAEMQWKLRNLYVEGVNLRRQYYSRFDNLMTSNDFNIDRVIDLWSTEG